MRIRRQVFLVSMALSLGIGTYLPEGILADSGADSSIVKDPRGDVVFETAAGNRPAGDDWNEMDLIEVWLGNETEASIRAGLQVDSWDPPRPIVGPSPRLHTRDLDVHIFLDGQEYRIRLGYSDCSAKAALEKWSPILEAYVPTACIPLQVDPALGIVEAVIPKADLTNSDGTPLRAGQRIDGFYAEARRIVANVPVSLPNESNRIYAVDRAPDSGLGPPLTIAVTGESNSTIQLTSPLPMRFSNGEATTLAFEVVLDNIGDRPESVFINIEGLPAGWSARVAPHVTLEPQETFRMPVIVTVPFSHEHGGQAQFNVTAATSEGATDSRVQLGVKWSDVPQPAGHHDQIFVHSARNDETLLFPEQRLWMNTLPDDAQSTSDSAWPSDTSYNDTRETAVWHFPLHPQLMMGLDFDTSTLGEMITQVSSPTTLPEATVSAHLLLCTPGEFDGREIEGQDCKGGSWHALVDGYSDPKTMSAGQLTEFMFRIAPSPESDIVPYVVGSNLMLEIVLETSLVTDIALTNQARYELAVDSTSMRLPLREYHDPIDRAFEKLGALSLVSRGDISRFANPGMTAVFSFSVKNHGGSRIPVILSIEGHNSQWAKWVEETDIVLGPEQGIEKLLAVNVPEDASQGERAEVFALATSRDDPSVTALSRIRVSVTTDQAIEDEAALLTSHGDKSVPGPAATIHAVVVVGVLMFLSLRKAENAP